MNGTSKERINYEVEGGGVHVNFFFLILSPMQEKSLGVWDCPNECQDTQPATVLQELMIGGSAERWVERKGTQKIWENMYLSVDETAALRDGFDNGTIWFGTSLATAFGGC